MQRLFARQRPVPESFEIRAAAPADRAALTRLTERSRRVHFHLDWWSIDDWIRETPATDCLLALQRGRIAGVLIAPPQDAPIAWVRLMAVADDYDPHAVIGSLLPLALDGLRAAGVEALACLAHPHWLAELLPRFDFYPFIDVTNFVKDGRAVPDYGSPSAVVRPATTADLPAVLVNDRAAFDPIWWYSLDSLNRILRDVAHFVVAEVDGRIVGHAFSDLYGRQGHLVRLAVHPDAQERGVGTRLLAESLTHLLSVGASPLTLNTQADNYTSQSLYRRFGYMPTGDSTTVMMRGASPYSAAESAR
jgi:ribosomal-protein-alanine N-acetyltransferase